MNDEREVSGGERRVAQHLANRHDDRALRRIRRGQDLGAEPALANGVGYFERDIGKGAADIDPEPPRCFPTHRHAVPHAIKTGQEVFGEAAAVSMRGNLAAVVRGRYHSFGRESQKLDNVSAGGSGLKFSGLSANKSPEAAN